MSRWLAIAEGNEVIHPTPADNTTEPDKTQSRGVNDGAKQPKTPFCQVLSCCQVGVEEKDKPPPRWSVGGRPMTKTGRIVSLAEWRNLSRNDRT